MWFKVSDDFHSHPKAMAAGPAAVGLWTLAGSWSAQQQTWGFIPHQWFATRGDRKLVRRLVVAGLLYRVKDGFWIVRDGLYDWDRTDENRRKIADELRIRIYTRDGYACVECGSTDDLTLDHIHPWSLGGADTEDNLRTLCRPCNSRKGARV